MSAGDLEPERLCRYIALAELLAGLGIFRVDLSDFMSESELGDKGVGRHQTAEDVDTFRGVGDHASSLLFGHLCISSGTEKPPECTA